MRPLFARYKDPSGQSLPDNFHPVLRQPITRHFATNCLLRAAGPVGGEGKWCKAALIIKTVVAAVSSGACLAGCMPAMIIGGAAEWATGGETVYSMTGTTAQKNFLADVRRCEGATGEAVNTVDAGGLTRSPIGRCLTMQGYDDPDSWSLRKFTATAKECEIRTGQSSRFLFTSTATQAQTSDAIDGCMRDAGYAEPDNWFLQHQGTWGWYMVHTMTPYWDDTKKKFDLRACRRETHQWSGQSASRLPHQAFRRCMEGRGYTVTESVRSPPP